MVKREKIYTVTVLRITDSHWKGSQRTWGWFPSLKEAQQSVGEAMEHYFEDGYYEYLVIEEYTAGALAFSYQEWWYAYLHCLNSGKETAVPIEKPKCFENIVHFAMG